MHWIDWLVALTPLVVIAWIIVWAGKHVRSVSDFLTGGRVAGRYLLAVSVMEASQGVFGLLAVYEAYYQSGFAYSFWEALNAPILIIMALTGYGVYRFRETRAMTMGQFLAIRYSGRFRIFAGTLQSISGVINYGLFPAVGGRFFVYFCGLPVETTVFGMVFPTFAIIMAVYLGIAALVATTGGQLTVMVADCIVGVLTYPMYLCVVAYLVWKFSWFHDLAPALFDRPAGHSLINPFDIAELRDFNLFYVLVGIFGGIVNRMSWSGNQGFFSAGKNAHEQKMAGVLATWRTGFSLMMYVLVPVVALAYFNSPKLQDGPHGAHASRTELGKKAVDDVLSGNERSTQRAVVRDFIESGMVTPPLQEMLGKTAELKVLEKPKPDASAPVTEHPPEPLSASANPVAQLALTPEPEVKPIAPSQRVQIAQDAIRSIDPTASQTFSTVFRQMSVPMAVRYILPVGILGMFCAICISLLMATDASYQHSWGTIIVQDVIMPLLPRPLSQRQHLILLRCLIVFVATFAFVFSYFFGQIDYILMFQAITGAIWLGGSGPCIIGGLYWKRGTTAAAWCTLIVGSSMAILSLIVQKYWVGAVYPWLVDRQIVGTVARWLETASGPFEPIIKWRMSADKFPINSQELFAITMLVSVGLYIVVSLLTSRQPYNMERMLHRGKYRREDEPIVPPERLTVRNAFTKLIGFDGQYTRGDKILAWSVFIYSVGWKFIVCFVVVAVWNLFSPWSNDAWSIWFYFNNFILAGVIGLVSTVWFTIGGTRDLRQLFKDLALKRQNTLDDGTVIGHVSADDVQRVTKVDHVTVQDVAAEK